MMKIGFLNTRVGQRILALFVAISLLPLAAIGWFAIRQGERALHRETFATLRAAADGAEAQIREFLHSTRERVLNLSRDEALIKEVEQLESSHRLGTQCSPQLLCDLLARRRRDFTDAEDIFVMDPAGRIVASAQATNLGRDLSARTYFQRGLQSFFPGDLLLEPDTKQLTWVMTGPIRQPDTGRLLGVLAYQLNPQTLSDLTTGRRVLKEGADTQCFRMGDTGETYIVNRAGWMITESRSISNAIFKVKVDSLPVRRARGGQETTADYRDYRGIEVSGTSMLLPDLGWVVLSEIDFSQAFTPLQQLRNALLALTVALCILVIALAYWSARWIVRPLQLLSAADKALAGGDETAAFVPETNLPNDEIGQFVRRRNVRLRRLLAHQRELLEEQKQRAEAVAELERMSYGIMHDMRAPLRAIIGFGDVVQAEAGEHLAPSCHQYLDRMKRAAARMDRLICDVLNYSRIVLDALPLQPVQVADLLRSIVETYPNLQNFRGSITLPETGAQVMANEAALSQCLSNLLDNAVKFTRPGVPPQVQVTLQERNGWLRITVDDNGIGIPDYAKEKLFGIFARGRDAGEGTGMGLAIVRKAVERMGGHVGMTSTFGQGSQFWIELRLARAVPPLPADSCRERTQRTQRN